MSSYQQQNQGGLPPLLGSPGTGTSNLPPVIGGRQSGLDAPSLPPLDLTQTTHFNPTTHPIQSLDEQALGRASMILDRVKNRQMSWQDAQDVLKTLSDKDKQTLAKFRPSMNEDERRALGMSKGGGGLLHSIDSFATNALYKSFILGPELVGAAIGGNNPVSRISGNFVNDVGTTVRTAPAGVAKIAIAGAQDFGDELIHPTGRPPHHLMDEVIKPMLGQYAHTYGPLFQGNVGLTLGRLADHPLQPLMDAFAVASAGLGTAGRVAAASKALDATKVSEAAADGSVRMGVVDRTTEQYAPLGINKDMYVRPTAKEIASDPQRGQFSVLINTKTSKSIFSPVGSGHDDMYFRLDDLGKGRQGWDSPDVVHGTGVFDPKTGKVAAIQIAPEDMSRVAASDPQGLIAQVKHDAESTYITAKDLKDTQRTNEAGTIKIAPGKPRGNEPPLWYIAKPNGQRIASNFPDKESAIAHAQSLVTGGVVAPTLESTWRDWIDSETGATRTQRIVGEGLTPKTPAQIARQAYLQRPQGSLIDAYERARGITHTQEIENILNDIVTNVLDNPDLRLERRSVGQTFSDNIHQVAEDIAASWAKDVGGLQGAMNSPEFAKLNVAMKGLGITLREVSDMVRAGAVFLRPAYIPNNWAGNGFLNTIHMGVFAPTELGKAYVIDKHIGTRYTRGIDQAMGFNAAEIAGGGRGAGYVASAVNPVSHFMGRVGDQPFRRAAWIHEARRAGYKTMDQIQALWDKANKEVETFQNRPIGKALEDGSWDPATTPALYEIGKISRASQEEIVKFGKYNDVESGILRNLIFVYSWMRGAGRYFGRFPLQHPIQAAVSTSVAAVGQNWLNQSLGGVPSFLIGAIPVGKDKNGNPILINPFTVNPLGTGLQMINSVASLKKIMTDPTQFNKYVDQDPAQLLNPLVASAIEAYGGGRPMSQTIPKSIAAYRLYENLQHPGRGQIYPTSRTEALGQYGIGSMFPRQASQQGITRALERERADIPEMRIPDEVKLIKDKLGVTMPPDLINQYRQDLARLKTQKDFQHSYAQAHGSQGFTNMPASNRAEAAIEYLTRYNLVGPSDLEQYQQLIDAASNDAEMNDVANSLWNLTGAGYMKSQWQSMVKQARDTQLTRKRP